MRWWRFQVLSKFFSTFHSYGWCLHNAYFNDDNDDNGDNDDDDDDYEDIDRNWDRTLSFVTHFQISQAY